MSIARDQPRNRVTDLIGTESSLSRSGLKVATFVSALIVIIVEAASERHEGGFVDYIIVR